MTAPSVPSLQVLVVALVAAAGCNNPRALNDHPDIAACKAATTLTSIPTWTGGAITVRYAAEGAPSCPAPKRVFVDADAGRGLRFIQVVDVDVGAPPPAAWSATAERPLTLAGDASRWVFLDASPDVRMGGEPFMNASTDGTFWDNPAWLDVPSRDESWTARSWAVVVDKDDSGRGNDKTPVTGTASGRPDATLGALGGFSWGFTWTAGAPMPGAVPPSPLDAKAWAADRALLARAFPALRFE